MNKIKRLFKRIYYKILILNKKLEIRSHPPSKSELLSVAITKKLINHPESLFLMAPLSGEKYIENKTLDIFVIIHKSVLSITNGVYHYDILLTRRNSNVINKMYNDKVEEIRQELKDEIMYKINNSLTIINNKLKWD